MSTVCKAQLTSLEPHVALQASLEHSVQKAIFFLQTAITNAFTLGSYFLLYCLQSGKDSDGKMSRVVK